MIQEIRTKILVGVESLREGPTHTRLMIFYRAFGSRPGRIAIWSNAEVASICGVSIAALKRARTTLIQDGKLERVTDPIGHYGYMAVPQSDGFPVEAEEILARKTGKYLYCTEERKREILEERIVRDPSTIPPIIAFGDDPIWTTVFPSLVDFSDASTWEFWSIKIPRTIAVKGHPLSVIKDKDIRANVAMSAISKLAARNAINPSWASKISDPKAYVLGLLSMGGRGYGIGKYQQDADTIEDSLARVKESGGATLRTLAEESVRGDTGDQP